MRIPIRLKLALSVCALGMCPGSIGVSPAFAEGCERGSVYANCAAGWMLTANTYPTALQPGGKGVILVDVMNVGGGASEGPVTVTDTLPPGVTAEEAGEGSTILLGGTSISHNLWDCSGNGPGGVVADATVVTCTNNLEEGHLPSIAGGGGNPGGPKGFDPVPKIGIRVSLAGGEESEMNNVTIVGGGAPTSASAQDPVTVTSKPASFGFEGWDVWASNADGTLDTQAGSHPYEVTFSYNLSNYLNATFGWVASGRPPQERPLRTRNIEARLPAGLVGDPNALPSCTRQQFDASQCPAASQVGIITVIVAGGFLLRAPVYSMVPPAGVPDEIAFDLEDIQTRLDTGVRSGSDYGLTTHVDDIGERDVTGSVLTLWGVPGDPSHNIWRRKSGENTEPEGCSPEELGTSLCPKVSGETKPFLTLPTSCGAPPTFSIWTNTWSDPNVTAEKSVQLHDSNGVPTGFTGCEHLSFAPTITTDPDTAKADTPAGLTVEVKPPVGGLSTPEGLSTADIQNTTVTLPAGLVINPGQAAGLQACQSFQDGLERLSGGEENNGPPSCPSASKVGTDEIETPLLSKPLQGNVYVLQSNPPELKLLVAASGQGVNVKLVGVVHLNEQTGQLTTTFQGTPELPFTDFKLAFSGGAQAALDTPTQCGVYGAAQGFSADFSSWASPFIADAFPTAEFAINQGPGGGPCPSSPLPFAPTMTAGSTTDQAGGFTNFSLLLQRADGQQRIEKLQFTEPPGLAGLLSQVPLCPEPQAAQGTCSAVSHIGHSVVTSGPGPYPLVIPQPGEPEAPIYLTGPYEGAPFGLSIVTPVIAGPFNLGTIVTRAKIEVDPHTAQITITTDPLPQIVKGVPTDLREINAIIDRPGFLFNPTNCNPQVFTGTATSAQGATAAISSHFGMGSCQSLKFKPKFSASASGKNSKAGGASLDVKVAYPSEPQGSEANIAKVKVDLPKQLPSRLTTLQKACTAAQFDANPAGCPAASVVGHAVVHTSVLPVPLEGPAYFVSNGGEAFPNLIMVLQGYGVTVDLVGDTFINKAGITSSTFKAVPDVPFNTFELNLPQGPNSALATNVPAKAGYSLCGQKLTMPTELVAQNGATIDQSTPIAIAGCAKTKALTRAQKLARALKACHRKPKGHKRVACEKAARKRFGTVKAKQKRRR